MADWWYYVRSGSYCCDRCIDASKYLKVAKKNLKKGEKLDAIGGFSAYGLCENAEQARKENLLPMGLIEDCILINDIPKDQAITFDDVKLSSDHELINELWMKQQDFFFNDRKNELKS